MGCYKREKTFWLLVLAHKVIHLTNSHLPRSCENPDLALHSYQQTLLFEPNDIGEAFLPANTII